MAKQPVTTAPPDPVASARSAIERLAEQERTWSTRVVELRAQLQAQQEAAAQASLADPDALATGRVQDQRLHTLAVDVATAERTVAAARAQRASEIASYFQVMADAQRQQAAALDAQAAVRDAEMAPSLADLEALQGAVVTFVGPTRSDTERAQARELRAQASWTAQNRAPDRGQASGASVEQLIAEVTSDPMQLAPPSDRIHAWVEEATAAWQRAHPDMPAQGLVYSVSWENAELLPERCTVQAPRPLREAPSYREGVWDGRPSDHGSTAQRAARARPGNVPPVWSF